MASVRYLLKNETINVCLNTAKNKRHIASTGLHIRVSDWDKAKGLPKRSTPGGKELYRRLIDLYDFLQNALNKTPKEELSLLWLKDNITKGLGYKTAKTPFLNIIDAYIERSASVPNKKGTLGLSDNTLASLRTFKSVFVRFQGERTLSLETMEADFLVDFRDYLKDKGYAPGSIFLFLRMAKAILRWCKRQKALEVNVKLDAVESPTLRARAQDIVVLSVETLDIIERMEIDKALKPSRFWLLLGCEIGQRYGDLIRVCPQMIKQLDGQKYIDLTQQKTAKRVLIPLSQRAHRLLERGFEKSVSYRKLWRDSKQICRAAGVKDWQKVGTHTCRRTFATNTYGIIPTALLKNITGHSTEGMLLSYIGKREEQDLAMTLKIFKEKNI